MSVGPLADARERLYRLPGARPPGRPRKVQEPAGQSPNDPPPREATMPAEAGPPSSVVASETFSPPRRLLDLEAGAMYLGISARTLRALIATRHVKPVKLPGVRRALVDVRDLDALIEGAKA